MKRIKSLFLIFFISLCTSLFMSCDKDDSNSIIVGEWHSVNSEKVITFKSNGTYIHSVYYDEVNPETGSYVFDKSTNLLDWRGYTDVVVFSNSNNKMQLTSLESFVTTSYNRQ